jgi:hypothetical protein
MKTPKPKHQTPDKHQALNLKGRGWFSCILEFGVWSLFGIWCLGFGV